MSLDPFHIPSHVHGFAALVAGYEAASESTRARLPSQLNIPYGEGPDEKLDLFFPEEPHDGARPIHMFIHGGYWRAQTKERYAFVADEVTAAGAIAAIIDYSLMPRARMATLVDQTRRAARWLGEHASTFGGDIGGRIKIISNVGLTQNLQFIKDGNIQAADVVYDNTYEGYAAVDQLIRVLTGKDLYKTPGVTDMRFAYNENVPQHLVTKENVGDPTVLWIAGNDAVKHYRELWGVEPRLSVRNLSVRFGTHLALDSLDLDVPAGRIIALLGANGSGKSTTVKALTGINPVGSGCRVSVGGVVLTADSFNPIAAKRLGIRVVHQEAPLVADLTVAETVAINLGFPTVGGFIRWKELTQTTLRRLGEFGVDIDPHRLCRSLNASERALVSLAIALGDIEVESAVLILDEATASLSTTDATRFLDHVREAADRGLAVLMVTHRLPEVRRYCDQIVVLRDGVTVARFDQESFDEWGVVRAMVGEAVQSGGDNHQASASRGAQVRGLDIHELSGDVLQDVTLSMRPGEIIGIAGRPGGGAAELLRALAGLEPEARGRATLGEVNLDLRSPL